MISFKIDWFDLLAVQGTLKSLLKHHNSETSILQHSAFFRVQLAHSYTTTGKTIALTVQTLIQRERSRDLFSLDPEKGAKKSIHGRLLILPSPVLLLLVEEVGSRARSSEADTGITRQSDSLKRQLALRRPHLLFYFAHTFHIPLHFTV